MKESEKIALMKDMVASAKLNLRESGNAMEAVRQTLSLVVDYIDFMLTPAELEDD